MKKRIIMVLSMLALMIMASGSAVFAEDTNFTAPKDGDYVLLGEAVDVKYIVGFTAANNQTYCQISVEDPKGETSTIFSSDSVSKDFEAGTNFTPTEEGTYKITSVCGNYIIMNMGMMSSKFRSPITTETISVNAVKTLPAAADDGSAADVKAGDVLKTKAASYTVLKDLKTVTYAGPTNKNAASANIPATVKIGGKTYKVTGIKAKAFYKCKKLKKITIGKNISSIGKSAFEGCSKLKTIIIKSSKLKLKKVGAKAFKGIYAKANVKVPKKQLKAYKSILKKRGAGKKIKVKGV